MRKTNIKQLLIQYELESPTTKEILKHSVGDRV